MNVNTQAIYYNAIHFVRLCLRTCVCTCTLYNVQCIEICLCNAYAVDTGYRLYHHFLRWWQVCSVFRVTKESLCSCLFTLCATCELFFILPLFLCGIHSRSTDAPHFDIQPYILSALWLFIEQTIIFFWPKRITNIHGTYATKRQCDDNFTKQDWSSWTKSEGWFVDWCCGTNYVYSMSLNIYIHCT